MFHVNYINIPCVGFDKLYPHEWQSSFWEELSVNSKNSRVLVYFSPKVYCGHLINLHLHKVVDIEKLHEDWCGVLDILLPTKKHLDVPGLSNKFEDGGSVAVCECSAEKIVFKSKCYIHVKGINL